ncbi:heparinase II/III domain-containing protein [Luteimonas viscosa]|nr:heparinase II/III family protein [Luteimonas viscosa]
MQKFQWPGGFRDRVEAFRRSNVALRSGRELLDSGTYRFRAFEPVAIDLFANWTANPVANRSWQWHSASFNFMPWLIALHADSGDQRAIDHATQAIDSWYEQFVAVDSGYEFAWHDHATANRLMAVLALLCHLDEYPADFEPEVSLPQFLAAHGDRLCLEEMYSRHTNHGIDQSRALLLLATCAPWLEGAKRWHETALARLADELGHAFAPDGGHVENSPGYHQFVANLFTDVLRTFGDALDADFHDRLQRTLENAAGFMAWIVRPDGRLPPIGDTEYKPAINVFRSLAGTAAHAHLQWVCSRGRDGEKPQGWAAVFPQAGYFIARSDWEPDVLPGDAFHLVFRCGRMSGYHRHDDDLSLTFWWGTDWFIDGGAYAYVEDHPVRRYLRSKWGHNVVVVDDGDYGWARPGAGAAGGMTRLAGDPGRPGARGETQSYPGLRAIRDVVMGQDRLRFEVRDELSLQEPDGRSRKFLSLWHVPADKTIRIDGQSVTITDRSFQREVVIRNAGTEFDDIRVIDAWPSGQEVVWSRELNRTERCQVLVFERSGGSFESRLEFQLHDRRPDYRSLGRINARPRGLMRSYVLDPNQWWPPESAHHARKIAARVGRSEKEGLSAEAFVEELYALAVVRQRHHRPTLHLANMGYPDAAIVESRLRAAMGMLVAGEVYLPGSIQRLVPDWPDAERLLLVDMVHLLHAAATPDANILNSVVNSSQSQLKDTFWRGNDRAVRALVTRDPVDAALNGMARARPASGWATEADAETALARQVERLKRFAGWAVTQRFALVFRVEDFAADPQPVLEEIARLCDSAVDVSALVSLPGIKPLSAEQSDAELESIHGLPARAMLSERLANVRAALGYD